MDLRAYGGLGHKTSQHRARTVAPADIPSRPLGARPLSDIREITEPSLYETVQRNAGGVAQHTRRPSRAESVKRSVPPLPLRPVSRHSHHSPFRSPETNDDRSSIYSIPIGSVPPRSSSKTGRLHAVLPPPPKPQYHVVSNKGQSQSPVKEAVRRLNAGNVARIRVPSKTIVKMENQGSSDILDHPTHFHPRLKLDLLVVAPLFVGGSSVEGTVRIVVDDAERARHRKMMTLERLSIDLLGIEEVGNRRHVFLALGNELVDLEHPPPVELVESQKPAYPNGRSWILSPSVSTLPFLLRLPLEVGPPPFHSRHARIRYVLCATMSIRDSGRQLCVRCSQDTAILSVYDPEKALMSLPSPLTATETCYMTRGHGQSFVTITAGLHRQVWVSGTNIFADVHIVNNSSKTIKKLEVQLERRVLCYKHAAASTLEMSASQARIFDQDERLIASKSVIKPGAQGWNGVLPHTTVLRTCDLELPRGHATIKCKDKYFEVRYFLNIIVGTSHTKPVTIQLPIILIHMNSLDVPTNSVAQVAAAIDEKRATRRPSRGLGSPNLRKKPSQILQGRAFNAPRTQSLDRARRQDEEIAELGRLLDESPRKNSYQHERSPYSPSYQQDRSLRKPSGSFTFKTPPSNRKGRIIENAAADEIRRRFGHTRGASHASNATSRSALPNRNNHYPPRASSALGHYVQSVEAESVERGQLGRGYASSSKPPSLVSSFELRKPRWATRPGWMKGDRHR